jgi:hypothetical protein
VRMQNKAGHMDASDRIKSLLQILRGGGRPHMELSRSTWLITSLSPGGGEKMSKHSVPAGDICVLLARFSKIRQKAFARTGKSFPVIVIQEAGLDGFWIHRVLQNEGSKAMSSIRPRLQHHVGAGERRPTGSTARRCFARCWRTSAVNLGCVQWSKRRLPRKRTAADFAANARC